LCFSFILLDKMMSIGSLFNVGCSQGWVCVRSQEKVSSSESFDLTDTDVSVPGGTSFTKTTEQQLPLEVTLTFQPVAKRYLKSVTIISNSRFVEVHNIFDGKSNYAGTLRGTTFPTASPHNESEENENQPSSTITNETMTLFSCTLEGVHLCFDSVKLKFASIKPLFPTDPSSSMKVHLHTFNLSIEASSINNSNNIAHGNGVGDAVGCAGEAGEVGGAGGAGGAGGGGGNSAAMMAMMLMMMPKGVGGTPPIAHIAAGAGSGINTSHTEEVTNVHVQTQVKTTKEAQQTSLSPNSTAPSQVLPPVRTASVDSVGRGATTQPTEIKDASGSGSRSSSSSSNGTGSKCSTAGIDATQLAAILWTVKGTIMEEMACLLDTKLAPVLKRLDRLDAKIDDIGDLVYQLTTPSDIK
jgi:hypothetical protein